MFISGIGSGYWILECAKIWRVSFRPYLVTQIGLLTFMPATFQNCEFVGEQVLHYIQHASPTFYRPRFGAPPP